MRKRIAWSFIGLALGAIGGWFAHTLRRKRIGDEDRPPIIVRGGSIEFETECGWDDAGGDWRPYHNEGRPVRQFIAHIRPVGQTECAGRELRGTILHFEHVHRFHVIITGREPMIGPRGYLRRPTSYHRTVKYSGGAGPLGEIRALPSNTTDWVGEGEEVCISFEYDD